MTEQIADSSYGCYGDCQNCGKDTDGSYYYGDKRVCRECFYATKMEVEGREQFVGAYAIAWGVIGWATIGMASYTLWLLYS